METRRARVARRLGVILASVLVVGSVFAGSALAQEDGGDGGVIPTGVIPTGVIPTGVIPTDIPTTVPTDIISTLTSIIPTGLPTGGSSAPTGPSGNNTIIQYSPYPYPVFGDYGKRYYGKYYDRGCGCDRYAAPTYVPQVVVATQVSSVPKGGVDTGDGSFQ